MTYHKTWFPVIVVVLTAMLGAFIYSVFQSRLHVSSLPTVPAVTAVEYQSQVHTIVGLMRKNILDASDDQSRITILNTDLDRLLALLVPGEYKDAHLEMVMSISQWIAGLNGDPQKVSSAQGRWQALVDQYSWIE